MKSGDKSTDKDDGESEEIMLETTRAPHDAAPNDSWKDFTIMKTVDYSVEEQAMEGGTQPRREAWGSR